MEYPAFTAGSGLASAPRSVSTRPMLSAKRALDIALSLIALPVALPLILLCAGLIKLGGGPAFYGHSRLGKNGKRFRCWKLRSMVVNADTRLTEYLAASPEARAEWEETHKLTDDPRITRLGHILRKSSLDELPQLWNVLRGEMSLVGPRPIIPDELRKYGALSHIYLDMRPGLTGLWQISGRNNVSYSERISLDAAYHRCQCLREDLAILMRTVLVVLRMTGR